MGRGARGCNCYAASSPCRESRGPRERVLSGFGEKRGGLAMRDVSRTQPARSTVRSISRLLAVQLIASMGCCGRHSRSSRRRAGVFSLGRLYGLEFAWTAAERFGRLNTPPSAAPAAVLRKRRRDWDILCSFSGRLRLRVPRSQTRFHRLNVRFRSQRSHYDREHDAPELSARFIRRRLGFRSRRVRAKARPAPLLDGAGFA